jgi:hypothetical protein
MIKLYFSFYRESDYKRGTNDFMWEEKQRKQMEAIADDLFNNAKVPTCISRTLLKLVECMQLIL